MTDKTRSENEDVEAEIVPVPSTSNPPYNGLWDDSEAEDAVELAPQLLRKLLRRQHDVHDRLVDLAERVGATETSIRSLASLLDSHGGLPGLVLQAMREYFTPRFEEVFKRYQMTEKAIGIIDDEQKRHDVRLRALERTDDKRYAAIQDLEHRVVPLEDWRKDTEARIESIEERLRTK